MSEGLTIRGVTVGKGRPLICVSVVEDTRDGIISEYRSLSATEAHIIEWRVDLFEQVNDTEAVLSVLEQLSSLRSEKLLLFTYRSRSQGGGGSMEKSDIEAMLQRVAESGYADLLDVEYFMSPDPGKLIRALKKQGAVVVASHHDFSLTPPEEAMMGLMTEMSLGGADIVKLAVMPEDMEDVLRLLSVTERFRREFPEQPMITMSMGRYGMLSRLCGEFFGVAVTFGSHTRASAPGQIDLHVLSTLLDRIHQSFAEGEG